MKTTIKLLVIAFLLFWVNSANAQPSVVNFSDLNDVYSLHYHNDTIWIGTTGGVVYRVYPSYTPEHIITFDNGLGSNYITAIEVDNNGTKFFGTYDNGLTTYNSGITKLYNQSNSSLNNQILCLAKDNNGDIWAGTKNGAFKFNGSTWNAPSAANAVSGEIRSIAVDGTNIWFGTSSNGLHLFNGTTWADSTAASGMTAATIITAVAARGDSVFVGTNSGIYFYEPGKQWIIDNTVPSEIYGIKFLNYSRYISTSNGLYYSTGSTWSLDGYFSGVKTGVIEKRGNSLWIGYNESGRGTLLYSFVTPGPPYVVTGPQYPGKNDIADITSRNNYVYVATYGNGISRYDGNIWEIFNASNSPIYNFTNSLAMQADTLWVGTDDGAYSYNGESWTLHTAITPVVNAVAVSKLNSDTVWCGTSNGVTRFVNGSQTDFPAANNLYNNEVIGIAIDASHNVWFLHKNGLTRYHNNAFDLKISLADLQASGAELNDISADLSSGIWIASNQGVIHYENGTITHYTNTDGLSDNVVLTVEVDEQNNKYFGTNSGGISMFSPVGWQKITRQNKIPMNRITAVHYQTMGNFIWSGGDWGGVSQIHFEPLSVTANSSQSVACYGDPVTLSAAVSGGFGPLAYNYSWTSANTNFSSTNESEAIRPEISDVYYLDVNDGFFAGSNVIQVNVNIVDTSDISGPAFICTDNVYSTYSVVPNTNKSYSWSVSGGIITSDPTLNKIEVQWYVDQTNGTIYLHESDNSKECAIEHDPVPITFDKSPKPNIVRKGDNMIICIDSGLVAYQWYFNEQMLPNENRQFYFYDSDQGLPAGVYNVEVSSNNSCKLLSLPIEVSGSNLKVYPLPATNTLNIDFSSDKLSSGKAEIYSLSGNKTDEITFDKEQVFKHLELNVSNYKPGIYSYKIYLGSERITSGKFIID